MRFPAVCLLVLACLTAGCMGRRHDLLAMTAVPAHGAVAGTHHVYIATTRARADDRREVFSGQRSRNITFARVDVSVPALHQPGRIERPRGDTPDPGRYFTARSLTGYGDGAGFAKALDAGLAARGGNALVFIHGYNTHFDDAVYRITQIAHDSGYKGVPVLFTWASAGEVVDYAYDVNSATAARDGLEKTLRLLARSGARRIDIVAHSLGNWATMEALRQLAITDDKDLGGKLGDVVLASPDIDIDVFKGQMERYGKPRRPFAVLASRRDRALDISSWIAGDKPRLGDYLDARDMRDYGVVVIDLSKARQGDTFGHTTFADNATLIRLLGKGLNEEDARALGRNATVTSRINHLAAGIRRTAASTADIVVTTPLELLGALGH